MLEPYWANPDLGVFIYHGEVDDIMPQLPDAAAHSVISDPPYGVTKEPWDCLFEQRWLDQMRRVTSPAGVTVAINAARPDVQRHMLNLEPLAARVVQWRQPNPTAGHGLFWTYQPIYIWGAAGELKGWDTISIAPPGKGNYQHPTQKPTALMEWLITGATARGDTVCDPFMGSGTTGVAAVRHSRGFIGIERDPGYVAIAVQRIKDEIARSLFAGEFKPAVQIELAGLDL